MNADENHTSQATLLCANNFMHTHNKGNKCLNDALYTKWSVMSSQNAAYTTYTH